MTVRGLETVPRLHGRNAQTGQHNFEEAGNNPLWLHDPHRQRLQTRPTILDRHYGRRPVFHLRVYYQPEHGAGSPPEVDLRPSLRLGHAGRVAFFLAYFVFSSPTSKLIETIGYKRTMVVSLFIQVVGCLMFVRRPRW